MAFKCSTVPLSPLMVWAYLRLVLSITYAASAYYVAWLLIHQNQSSLILMTTIWIGLTLVNWTFSNILIVGLHNKSYMMLLIFLIYSVLEVVLTAAWQLWYVDDVTPLLLKDSNSFYNYWRGYLNIVIPFMFNMLLPTYFIVAIRRVLLKIKEQNSREVGEWVKKTTEETNVNSPVVVEQEIYHFNYPSAPPEEIAVYPVEELQSLSIDNNKQSKNID